MMIDDYPPLHRPPYKVYQVSPSCSADDLEQFINLKVMEGYRLFAFSDGKIIFECEDRTTSTSVN